MKDKVSQKDYSYKAMIGLYGHKCKVCGKVFECRSEYVYKIERAQSAKQFYWFCSYKHMREYEQKKADKKKPSEKELIVLSLLKEGVNLHEIGRQVGVSHTRVGHIRDKWEGVI